MDDAIFTIFEKKYFKNIMEHELKEAERELKEYESSGGNREYIPEVKQKISAARSILDKVERTLFPK